MPLLLITFHLFLSSGLFVFPIYCLCKKQRKRSRTGMHWQNADDFVERSPSGQEPHRMAHSSETPVLKNTESRPAPFPAPCPAPRRPAPWLSAGHRASRASALPPWYPDSFPYTVCCFSKMVTFIDYKYLYHNSDLLTGSWEKIFSLRTTDPQNCLSMPLLSVV